MFRVICAAVVAASPATVNATVDGQPATVSATVPINARAVVGEVRRIIAEGYVLPDRRAQIDQALAAGLASGRYDVSQGGLLAERITADLARVSQDGHLYLRYDPARVASRMARNGEGRPDPSIMLDQARQRNHGIRELRVLPGNIRYADISAFDFAGEESERVINAAMDFLKDGQAVIIDLRRNGGGNGRAVNQIISQFVEADRPLISFQRGGEMLPTISTMRGLSAMIGKPLYVLTSRGSGSAAEELAAHVAGFRIGHLVGETTSGASYMNELFGIEGGFELSVSVARPIIASTGRDWERVGVAPTIPTSAQDALNTAHVHALRAAARLSGNSKGPILEGMAAGLEAIRRPGTAALPLRAYVGTYGDRRVVLSDGTLWYHHADRPRSRMVPVGGHIFTLEDDPSIRLSFTATGSRITGFGFGPAGGAVLAQFEKAR